MYMSQKLKFHDERGGAQSEHNGDLTWPGTPSGFPFRGEVPNLRQEEYDEIVHVYDFKSELFILADPEQKARFDMVMDRIVNGWYKEKRRVDRWSEAHLCMVVWLEWLQIYGESTIAKHPSMSNAQPQAQSPHH